MKYHEPEVVKAFLKCQILKIYVKEWPKSVTKIKSKSQWKIDKCVNNLGVIKADFQKYLFIKTLKIIFLLLKNVYNLWYIP